MKRTDPYFLVATGHTEEADLIRNSLVGQGYKNVFYVPDGPAALKALKSDEELFVITAWELPRLGGLRLVKEIRSRPYSEDWPCLIIVPGQYESEMNMARGVQVNGFLPRPLSEPVVIAKVNEVLEKESQLKWPRSHEAQAHDLEVDGRLQEALHEYHLALKGGRTAMAEIHTNIGIILFKKQRLNEAIDHLERAAVANPLEPRTLTVLGRAYLQTGLNDQALRILDRAVQLVPKDESTQKELTDVLLIINQSALAEKLLAKLLLRQPQNSYLLNRMGIALRKQKKYKQAIKIYLEAIKLNDQDEHLYFNLGRCYFELGRMGRATAAVNQALNINPGFQKAREFLLKIPQL